jgi:hypothetical protein
LVVEVTGNAGNAMLSTTPIFDYIIFTPADAPVAATATGRTLWLDSKGKVTVMMAVAMSLHDWRTTMGSRKSGRQTAQ